MIRIIKHPSPQILEENWQVWTAELLRLIAAGASRKEIEAVRNRYRHADIKAVVCLETFDKCAFCESKMTHVYYGDIEHVQPKSIFVELTFVWHNLVLACRICNNNKLVYPKDGDPFVNPVLDNPDAHLFFSGDVLFPRPGSDAGFLTIDQLKLNRRQLRERRSEKIENLWRLIDRWSRLTNSRLKEIARQEIMHEISSEKEFSMALKAFAAQCGVPLD